MVRELRGARDAGPGTTRSEYMMASRHRTYWLAWIAAVLVAFALRDVDDQLRELVVGDAAEVDFEPAVGPRRMIFEGQRVAGQRLFAG